MLVFLDKPEWNGLSRDTPSPPSLTLLSFPLQACLLLAPSHPQCRLLEPFHLGYHRPCRRHLCLLGLEDTAPHQQEPQGLDTLDMDIHILIHSHRAGCPTQDTPTLGPQALEGSRHPDHHLECLILDLLRWACLPEAPRHPGPMPPHGMRGPPPLMPPHGYTGPPRPPPYGYQRGPLPPPRPTPRPPVPPRGPLRGPLPQ
ncbi:Splicing factor 3B subunit 4 [Galemys pyrenaicus]|uniref:Splicing factor 3B subunit 4 n=1 Tax=Galemys pyrenaicus TaxID=202257 RepID=A0A8J6A0B9_GALPY|nr:Splicing factor 3B subunit 4 [Galemys pyrenaicus]